MKAGNIGYYENIYIKEIFNKSNLEYLMLLYHKD